MSWPATSSRADDHLDISHGVISSPATAPTNRAAVAAPAAPCGPLRSIRTGTTGSSRLKLIAMVVAIPASTSEGLRERAIAVRLCGSGGCARVSRVASAPARSRLR